MASLACLECDSSSCSRIRRLVSEVGVEYLGEIGDVGTSAISANFGVCFEWYSTVSACVSLLIRLLGVRFLSHLVGGGHT